MEDGESPLIGLVIFIVLVIADAILYGFSAAVDNVNDRQVEKRKLEGSKQAVWLQKVKEEPYRMVYTLQLISTIISIVVGICQVQEFGNMLAARLLVKADNVIFFATTYLAVSVVAVFLLVSLGIIAPQKIAMRKSEKWAFRLAGIVHGLVILFTPISYLADKLSNLAVRILGLDPNENVDDVTEDEIISMVNEGHEQGVLLASEAEMIHNIFQFGDKEAKDIMTHRKNIVGVDGNMAFSEALEFMLDKNNSRFPVYQDDIDNITGVVHIKDAMILSRDVEMYLKPINQVPGLVREISFIPETRNIHNLFKAMQSKKIHMVVVVDEYGQTAGLVAMEDILEEIVGNILDEYDEEDTMIIAQNDGSYLMEGMAPFNEICEILGIICDLEDYDTLNGFLISLIDKIPGDDEVFEIKANGYLFQVLTVENKMIQTVRVRAVVEEETKDFTCKEAQSVIE